MWNSNTRKGLPELKSDNDLRRGKCDQKIRSDEIGLVKWKETRPVVLSKKIRGTLLKSRVPNLKVLHSKCRMRR